MTNGVIFFLPKKAGTRNTFNEWFSRHLVDPSDRHVADLFRQLGIMIFQEGIKAELVCPKSDSGDGYEHLLMGEPYMTLSK